MLEAILLVGGKGTRLRPLTISIPKPMLPVAGFSCTEHQIAWAREAGVTRIVLGTSYKSEVFEKKLGHGEKLGVELIYAVEEKPLGTGGAIRNAAKFLASKPEDPIIIFNGDVLTGLDIEALIAKWRDAKADVAIYLTRVDDPSAYGLVPTDENGIVSKFLEKPTNPYEIVTNQINAGCYVFKRSVIDQIPEGKIVSVERDTFPKLLANNSKVIGVIDNGYWLDLGTPLAFAKGSADLVLGIAPSPLIYSKAGEAIIENSAKVDPTAKISGGSYIGHNAKIGKDAEIYGAVIFDNVEIGAGARVSNSIISTGAQIGDRSVITDAVIAERAKIGSDNELKIGVRVFPDSIIGDSSIRFSSDQT